MTEQEMQKRLRRVYHEYELPEHVNKSIFSRSIGSEIKCFLQETKFCHDLFDYNSTNKTERKVKKALTKEFYKQINNLLKVVILYWVVNLPQLLKFLCFFDNNS